jgi:hypothetical protein
VPELGACRAKEAPTSYKIQMKLPLRVRLRPMTLAPMACSAPRKLRRLRKNSGVPGRSRGNNCVMISFVEDAPSAISGRSRLCIGPIHLPTSFALAPLGLVLDWLLTFQQFLRTRAPLVLACSQILIRSRQCALARYALKLTMTDEPTEHSAHHVTLKKSASTTGIASDR